MLQPYMISPLHSHKLTSTATHTSPRDLSNSPPNCCTHWRHTSRTGPYLQVQSWPNNSRSDWQPRSSFVSADEPCDVWRNKAMPRDQRMIRLGERCPRTDQWNPRISFRTRSLARSVLDPCRRSESETPSLNNRQCCLASRARTLRVCQRNLNPRGMRHLRQWVVKTLLLIVTRYRLYIPRRLDYSCNPPSHPISFPQWFFWLPH